MHKIIFLFSSTYGDAFFKGFAEELIKQGNQVLFANLYKANLEDLEKDILDFKPTILFSFNLFNFRKLNKLLPQKKSSFWHRYTWKYNW